MGQLIKIDEGFWQMVYTDAEVEAAWLKPDRYFLSRMFEGEFYTAKVKCTKDTAIEIAQLWLTKIFTDPACQYYDGQRLWLYCGAAGSNAATVLAATEALIDGYLAAIRKA
jgi:hypothetical protein